MDDHRSPSVATLLGVTLGLLILNWLSVTYVGVRSLVFGDTYCTALTFCFFSGPIWLFIVAAWVGRRRRQILGHCLKFALAFAVFAYPAAIVAVVVPDRWELIFLAMWGGFLLWVVAWPFGILALASTFRGDNVEPGDEPE